MVLTIICHCCTNRYRTPWAEWKSIDQYIFSTISHFGAWSEISTSVSDSPRVGEMYQEISMTILDRCNNGDYKKIRKISCSHSVSDLNQTIYRIMFLPSSIQYSMQARWRAGWRRPNEFRRCWGHIRHYRIRSVEIFATAMPPQIVYHKHCEVISALNHSRCHRWNYFSISCLKLIILDDWSYLLIYYSVFISPLFNAICAGRHHDGSLSMLLRWIYFSAYYICNQ